MDAYIVITVVVAAISVACNGKINQPDGGQVDAQTDGAAGDDGALQPPAPATCPILPDGGLSLCPPDAPVCLGVGYHIYGDAGLVGGGVSYECASLGMCAQTPTCACLMGGIGATAWWSSHCAAITAGSCHISDAGIQFSCSGG